MGDTPQVSEEKSVATQSPRLEVQEGSMKSDPGKDASIVEAESGKAAQSGAKDDDTAGKSDEEQAADGSKKSAGSVGSAASDSKKKMSLSKKILSKAKSNKSSKDEKSGSGKDQSGDNSGDQEEKGPPDDESKKETEKDVVNDEQGEDSTGEEKEEIQKGVSEQEGDDGKAESSKRSAKSGSSKQAPKDEGSKRSLKEESTKKSGREQTSSKKQESVKQLKSQSQSGQSGGSMKAEEPSNDRSFEKMTSGRGLLRRGTLAEARAEEEQSPEQTQKTEAIADSSLEKDAEGKETSAGMVAGTVSQDKKNSDVEEDPLHSRPEKNKEQAGGQQDAPPVETPVKEKKRRPSAGEPSSSTGGDAGRAETHKGKKTGERSTAKYTKLEGAAGGVLRRVCGTTLTGRPPAVREGRRRGRKGRRRRKTRRERRRRKRRTAC